jgi:hypothetical protein
LELRQHLRAVLQQLDLVHLGPELQNGNHCKFAHEHAFLDDDPTFPRDDPGFLDGGRASSTKIPTSSIAIPSSSIAIPSSSATIPAFSTTVRPRRRRS